MLKGQAYRSRHILYLAKLAESRIVGNNGSEVPIILSAASLETFVNEFPYLVGMTYKSTPSLEILKDINSERTSPLFRIRMMYFVLMLKQLDRGSQPFQDVSLLFSLRNMIIHREIESFEIPEEGEAHPEKPNIVNQFVSRGIIKQPSNPVSGWSQYLLVQPVASWATTTVLKTFRWVHSLVRDEESKTLLKFHIQEIIINAG